MCSPWGAGQATAPHCLWSSKESLCGEFQNLSRLRLKLRHRARWAACLHGGPHHLGHGGAAAKPSARQRGQGWQCTAGSIVCLRTAQAFPGGRTAEQQLPALSCPQTSSPWGQVLSGAATTTLPTRWKWPGTHPQILTKQALGISEAWRSGPSGPCHHVPGTWSSSSQVQLAASGPRLLDSRRTLPAIMAHCHQMALPRPVAAFNLGHRELSYFERGRKTDREREKRREGKT